MDQPCKHLEEASEWKTTLQMKPPESWLNCVRKYRGLDLHKERQARTRLGTFFSLKARLNEVLEANSAEVQK